MPVRKQGKLCWISHGIFLSHGYILSVQLCASNIQVIIRIDVKL